MASKHLKVVTEDDPPTAEFFSDRNYVPTVLAYDNQTFLNSQVARPIRILCEYQYPKDRLKQQGVYNTILFIGSAKAKSSTDHAAAVAVAEKRVEDAKNNSKYNLNRAEEKLARLHRTKWLTAMHDSAVQLAKKLAEWGKNRGTDIAKHYVATGGGPGIMLAANYGASLAGAKSVGMVVSMPKPHGDRKYSPRASREKTSHSDSSSSSRDCYNEYVSPELAFSFHYFFLRKFWMVMPARCLIAFPGGLGTLDELFEHLTLIQCRKTASIPIVLFGKKYWQKCINWDLLVERGTVSPSDRKRLFFTDSVEEAYRYITDSIVKNEKERVDSLSIAVGFEKASTLLAAPFEEHEQ
eukprot:g5348.t1